MKIIDIVLVIVLKVLLVWYNIVVFVLNVMMMCIKLLEGIDNVDRYLYVISVDVLFVIEIYDLNFDDEIMF